MGKNIISISLSGPLTNDIIDQEIRRLCDEKEMDYQKIFDDIGVSPDINTINAELEKIFPGELKIIK